MLATEGDLGHLTLRAIAAGWTGHAEIRQAVGGEPARVLERLVELQLVERLVPAGDDPAGTRRRTHRIADNFLAFWLGVLDRHRSAIELDRRGAGDRSRRSGWFATQSAGMAGSWTRLRIRSGASSHIAGSATTPRFRSRRGHGTDSAAPRLGAPGSTGRA